ncbi:MAG: hypothetical protein JW874_14545 [Spirochaetales bacterium]|nr:hypothetical protein [Spirochaetales bacterium]
MIKSTTCLSALLYVFLVMPWQLAASGISDKPGLAQYDVSCNTASPQKGFLWAIEGSASIDPGFSAEANVGAGFLLGEYLGLSANVSAGACGWEDDVENYSEVFLYGLAGAKISYKYNWFSCALDVRVRFGASTDELDSPDILIPALLIGFGRKEFLTLGLIGQGVSATFHWRILHVGIYFQPPPVFCDFSDIGVKLSIGRY